MPQLGESVTEGTVDKWLKHEGDFVKRDEPLVEVVTDKVNAEIPSPFEGKLVKITAGGGERARLSPAVRKLAAEHGIDPTSLRGSGLGGRVTRDDVLASVGTAQAEP